MQNKQVLKENIHDEIQTRKLVNVASSIYHYNEVINQNLHYIIEKVSRNMRKTSNKKHLRGGKVYSFFYHLLKSKK